MSGFSKDDPLGEALAFEEHRQGKPYGDDPDHCGDCAAESRRQKQATCAHKNVVKVDLARLDHGMRWLESCRDCGLDLRDVSESNPW